MKTKPKSATTPTNSPTPAEDALSESEERFRQLSEAAFEAIILHDNVTIVEVNQSFCRMYGYERAEVIGNSVLDLALPNFRELLSQKVRSGDTDPNEGLALRKDGTVFRAEVAAKPIYYQGRSVRVAAIRDITEQKRNERRQAAQYAVTRVLAESATLAEATPQLLKVICESLRWKMGEFWRVCDGTNLLRCVESWHVPTFDAASFIEASRQIGLAPGTGLPGRVWQSGQPEWIPDVTTDPGFVRSPIAAEVGLRGAVAFPISLGNVTLGVMLFFSRRDPEVDEDLIKIMSAIGSQIGQFTERKRVEEALVEESKIFEAFFQNTVAPLVFLDKYFNFILVNEAYAKACQREISEFSGHNHFEFFSSDAKAIFERVVETKELFQTFARPFIYPDHPEWGVTYWDWTLTPILDQKGEVQYLAFSLNDVTVGKRADEALRESEERYRDLVENSSELICTHDLEGRILSANRVAAEIMGVDSGNYIGKRNFREILAPEVRDRFDDYLARISKDGFADGIMLVQTSTGERRLWEYHNTLRTDGVAAPIVRGMARDITERKRAGEALKKSESDYRHLFNNANDAILIFEPEGEIILETNAAACDIYGYSRDELIGTSMKRFTKSVLAGESQIHELLDVGTASNYESIHFNNKGGEIYFLINASVIDYQDRKAILSINHNITERKLQEEALRESETLLKQSQRVAVLGHYVLDFASGLWTNSEVLDEIFGIDAAYTKNVEGWLGLVHPEQRDEMNAYLSDHVLKERNSFDKEYRIVRINDNVVRWVHGLGNLEFNTDEQPARMFGVIQDITESKLVEEELNATAEKLRSLSARLQSAREDEGTRIAREIHDELGASLTGLKWDLEGIDKVLSGAGNVAEVQAARKKLPNMTGLINSTIDTVRRISAELRPGGLDDLGLVAAIEWQASQLQTRTGIKCKCVTAVNGTDMSRERATAVFRIFQEILTNITRHAHATKVNIELTERDGCLELRVKDNGLGITREEKQGAGSLGLLGMSERARQIGGEVSISGVQGKGTTVVVRVPTT